MSNPACKEFFELKTSNEVGEGLFEALFKDHTGNHRRIYFYSQDHDTAESDLRVLSKTFDPLSIGQLFAFPSIDISREEMRKRIESHGGVIVDEELFKKEYPV
jgi:hypothetical protein